MSFGTHVCGQIVCPEGHTILVPRQTPSKIFPGPPYPPTDIPKATFLCIVCGSQFPCSPPDFRPFQYAREDRGLLHPVLCRIEGECVHENCGKLRPIYFGYDDNGREGNVRQRALEFVGEMECEHGQHRQCVKDLKDERSWVSVVPIARQDDEYLP